MSMGLQESACQGRGVPAGGPRTGGRWPAAARRGPQEARFPCRAPV